MRSRPDIHSSPVDAYMHDNFLTLDESITVARALDKIRKIPDDGRVVYYYTRDVDGRLTGVVPARILVASSPEAALCSISKKDIVSVAAGSSMKHVARLFASHRYLSLPVVDHAKRVIGVVDLKPFTQRDIDISDRLLLNEIFQTIGLRVSTILAAGPAGAFGHRFPWLLSTLLSGLVCAFLVGLFELTLASSIVLAFFITMVLALGEAVSIQSMSIALQLIHQQDRAGLGSFLRRLAREAAVGALLGSSCGAVAFAVSAIWRGALTASAAIGVSITLSIIAAACIGLSIPLFLHAVKKDPRIAAGPLVLAATDICTVLIYMTIAKLLLA